jgi:zinc transport system substrate-binding protein
MQMRIVRIKGDIMRPCSSISLLVVLISSTFLTSCNSATTIAKPIIGVSIVPETAFVSAVAGNLADIVTVVPPGYSPATYEPSPVEMLKLTECQAFFSIGVPSESSFVSLLNSETKLINLADEASVVYDELELNGGRDPHVWLSIKRVKIMINTIATTLGEIDPDNANSYLLNAANYILELDTADNYIESILENIPTRKFIVFHPAFGYFADDYALEMYAIERSGSEATIQDLMDMIDFAKVNNITVVFNQAEVDDSWITSFTEEIEGGTFVTLSPLSSDYINNLKYMAEEIAVSMPNLDD